MFWPEDRKVNGQLILAIWLRVGNNESAKATTAGRSGLMSDPERPESQNEDAKAVLERWQERLRILVGQVKTWVERAGWRTRIIEKPINDRKLGTHKVPVLLMEKDTVEVALNPVSPLGSWCRGGR